MTLSSAKAILLTAQVLSPTTTLEEARKIYPALREVKPGVWSSRLDGSHSQDSIDLRLTFRPALVEVQVRGTIWNEDDLKRAVQALRRSLSCNLGKAARKRSGKAPQADRWTSRYEAVRVERRHSEEDGRYLGQAIFTRTFKQPEASLNAAASLNWLMDEVPSSPMLSLPVRKSWHPPRSEADEGPKWAAKADWETKLNWPRMRVDGPYLPKWKTGRQRVAPGSFPIGGPLFFRTEFHSDLADATSSLKTLEVAIDNAALRSDWAPVRHADEVEFRYHSDRWWWLGGGVMLHAYIRDFSMFGETSSKIFIDAYGELDGPPEQSTRPTPTLHQVINLVSAATYQARSSLAQVAT